MRKVNGYEIGPGVNLTNASLRGANLEGVNLQGASLRDANLRDAYLTIANLQGANLTGADLQGARLRGANLRDADLSGALWDSRTIWPDGYRPPKREVETARSQPTEIDLLKQQVSELKKMNAAQQNQFTQQQKQRSLYALCIMGIIVGTKLSGYW